MFRVRRSGMPRLFSCCLSASIIFVGEFVAPYRMVDCSDEIVKDFYHLSVMSVDFRLFVNNDCFDERAQYFGCEFFETNIGGFKICDNSNHGNSRFKRNARVYEMPMILSTSPE